MIPYVIINGVDSRTINGLMVQSLPPITKPKVRVNFEEIDGRDGDIARTLGYSAYDKTITIGLCRDYDVNQVIEYFNTKGKITFSNELDKYYNFAIYNQIDLEKLVRYRTANVTLHVQPFKYPTEEETVVNTVLSQYQYHNVVNNGNIESKPIYTIKGDGNIYITINDKRVMSLNLNNETIILNVEEMNAYDAAGNFLNRRVIGDYNDLTLKSGKNVIFIEGVTELVSIKNYERWI